MRFLNSLRRVPGVVGPNNHLLFTLPRTSIREGHGIGGSVPLTFFGLCFCLYVFSLFCFFVGLVFAPLFYWGIVTFVLSFFLVYFGTLFFIGIATAREVVVGA